ncbi:MAG: hypothetical protein ACFFCQ_00115 [Promethearchaeota archaeon]
MAHISELNGFVKTADINGKEELQRGQEKIIHRDVLHVQEK